MAAKKKMASGPGNIFEFYVPSGAPDTPKPIPTPTASSKGGKSKYAEPGKFIKNNFVVATSTPFGSQGDLPDKNCIVTDLEIVRAALECGYGRRSNWNSALALNPNEASDLASYLLLRLQMVASCLMIDGNQSRIPCSFYKRVEASDKVALSFILGGIGTHLAARKWLQAGGDSIKAFLHTGIYTKGISGAKTQVYFKTSSGKSPDFLVEAASGQWHVFESKGGKAQGRWARIVEGLVQLSNLPLIGWKGKATASVTTAVCVHTSVDTGEKLYVTAVDPPPFQKKENGSLQLIYGVCKLLALLETLDQYRALADNLISSQDLKNQDWVLATSSRFGGLVVGIPKEYFRFERLARRQLAIYLAVSEIASEDDFKPSKKEAKAFVDKVIEKLFQANRQAATPINFVKLKQKIIIIAQHIEKEDFIYQCSLYLRLEELAKRLFGKIDSNALPIPDRNLPFVTTSGGMFVQQLQQNPPPIETVISPEIQRR